jgi:hypothetical protein
MPATPSSIMVSTAPMTTPSSPTSGTQKPMPSTDRVAKDTPPEAALADGGV